MTNFLNLGSIILGLTAWALPIAKLMGYRQHDPNHWTVFTILSISTAAVALLFQIMYTNHLVGIEDWSALLDTAGAVTFVSMVLIAVTILLNFLSFRVYHHRKSAPEKEAL